VVIISVIYTYRISFSDRVAIQGAVILSCLLGQVAVHSADKLAAPASPPISYNAQIRPLLSDKCFRCHGPDQNARKAKLRLDQAESAVAKKAIVPGQPDQSSLVSRINSRDPKQVMPPPEVPKSLTPAEKELLRTWIAQGAKYEPHWAYILPVKPSVPDGQNGIDYLIHQRLTAIGLQPSPTADRRTLTRRLCFDLVGLPPTPAEVTELERDLAPEAYSRFVQQLLSSPHYGERMAIPWLDVVRFADTIGYHSDNPRNIWPYRDYVIQSFNTNKPFDKFTREQIAGDLLPNCGLEQRVGSAFNRLLLSTEEGGAQPKDYEYRMLTDRVRSVGTVWLGQTFGCSACHDHKFDPVKMKDFYSLGAFFADIKEPIIGRREPGMLVPDPNQETQLARLETELSSLTNAFNGPHPELESALVEWERDARDRLAQEQHWQSPSLASATAKNGTELEQQPDGTLLAKGKNPDKEIYTLAFTNLVNGVVALRLDALPEKSLPATGPGRAGNGNFVITEVVLRKSDASGNETPVKIRGARADIEQASAAEKNPYGAWVASAVIDNDAKGDSFGWAILPETGKVHYLVLELAEELRAGASDSLLVEIRQNHGEGNHTLGHFRIVTCASAETVARRESWPPAQAVADLLKDDPSQAGSERRQALLKEFKNRSPLLEKERQAIARAEKALNDYEASVPRCLVTVTNEERRTVHILPRGDFLKESAGEIVEPALPAYLAGAHSSTPEHRLSRLELADWLVSKQNPLTARVTVNRLWKQFFGMGLSRVLDDLGSQGEAPPNQPLLDWLACEFMDSGWDIKHIVRLIVTSQAYQQSSVPTPELRNRDPYNREIACQSRWRLEAELVRDSALSFAGILNLAVGGPSAKPYQPAGYWDNLNFPTRTYEASTGDDQFRRGLYTWWQRSYVHPSMVAFDAPTREECVAERTRSNIPQQALVLLNDPTYVEAARAFGLRILKSGGNAPSERIVWAWRQALARDPQPEELQALAALQAKMFSEYQKDPATAEMFLKVGETPSPEGVSPAELASWAQVARAILNLHETITRS
jgi:hypothetical protein